MRNKVSIALSVALLWSGSVVAGQTQEKTRIAIVSSYHKAYLWSQHTSKGVNAALQEWSYLDNADQGLDLERQDTVVSSRSIIRKFWMDTKRRSSRQQIKQAIGHIVAEIKQFQPDIILLGDDNATNHIGNQFVDTQTPVVFWGVNGNPMKYGLLDSVDRPGHNVTGVYQAGYLREGVATLKQLIPQIRTLGVLSDDSPTSRAKVKELDRLSRQGRLPLELVDTVVTNSLSDWKAGALKLNTTVDAVFLLNHNTLKDDNGAAVDQLEIGAWYLRNVTKPDLGHERQFVEEGVLCAVDDSGFKQGYEAVRIAHRILSGEQPAAIRVYAPDRGPFIVNLERARMLGIEGTVTDNPLVEELLPNALALEDR